MQISCPRDFLPIVAVSYFGHLTTVGIILRERVLIESDIGAYSFHWAWWMGSHKVIDLLLWGNFSPDTKIVNGQSALLVAVHFNCLDVVKRLLRDEGAISEGNEY
jgi:hypothetical protein